MVNEHRIVRKFQGRVSKYIMTVLDLKNEYLNSRCISNSEIVLNLAEQMTQEFDATEKLKDLSESTDSPVVEDDVELLGIEPYPLEEQSVEPSAIGQYDMLNMYLLIAG